MASQLLCGVKTNKVQGYLVINWNDTYVMKHVYTYAKRLPPRIAQQRTALSTWHHTVPIALSQPLTFNGGVVLVMALALQL